MATEGATNIDELDPSRPASGEGVGEIDDHMRMVKQVLENILPGNTAPGLFGISFTLGTVVGTGEFDAFIRHGFFEGDADIKGEIKRTPQVAIASFCIDGTDGSLIGPSFGVTGATLRSNNGEYEVQLSETQWDGALTDLSFAVMVDNGVAGAGGAVVRPGVVNPESSGWLQITTVIPTSPNVAQDCIQATITVFDRGRT